MILSLFLVFISLSTSTCLAISVRKNLILLDKLEEIDESIQETLDILDEQFKKIEQKTKIEVFSDEPIVRNLVQDIVIARDAVLKSAKILDDAVGEVRETETIET